MLKESSKFQTLYNKGKIALRKHANYKALKYFNACIDIKKTESFSQRALHYWLGISLLKIDRPELAIKQFLMIQKHKKRGKERKLYNRFVNEYGMQKQKTRNLDDFYAFHSIKLQQFIHLRSMTKTIAAFSPDEVFKTIVQYWMILKNSNLFSSMTTKEKVTCFLETKIPYSFFSYSIPPIKQTCYSIKTRKELNPESRCICGSGLPWQTCCGRIKSLKELY